jgi:hypothetical protein
MATKMTTHLHLVLRIRSISIPPLLHALSWRGDNYICFDSLMIIYWYISDNLCSFIAITQNNVHLIHNKQEIELESLQRLQNEKCHPCFLQ